MMIPVGLTHFLVLGAILFALGLLAVITKRNAVTVLMGVELIINAANINFIAFARYLDKDIDGQMFGVFVIVVAAASAAVALASKYFAASVNGRGGPLAVYIAPNKFEIGCKDAKAPIFGLKNDLWADYRPIFRSGRGGRNFGQPHSHPGSYHSALALGGIRHPNLLWQTVAAPGRLAAHLGDIYRLDFGHYDLWPHVGQL
jgi:NADH-quinone oxidoreductase subunit K